VRSLHCLPHLFFNRDTADEILFIVSQHFLGRHISKAIYITNSDIFVIKIHGDYSVTIFCSVRHLANEVSYVI